VIDVSVGCALGAWTGAVTRLRDLVDRVQISQCIEFALAALRQAHPAAVSPTWGVA
jgi:hypothetical protein